MSENKATEHQQQQESKNSLLLMNKNRKTFKGIRRRKWGKWVSEIRVPGTSNRLWLGSYTTAEAAAAAHDVASFYLKSSSKEFLGVEFNFPEMVRKERILSVGDGLVCLSPRSVQKAASDAGMAVDAAHRVVSQRFDGGGGGEGGDGGEGGSSTVGNGGGGKCNGEDLNISVDDYL